MKAGTVLNDLEKALLQKCKKGDLEAFEKLIDSYQKKVFNLCYRYLDNYDDAEELSQEVFIKVYRAISGFKEESSLGTWIYRIAVTTCIDELRKKKKYTAVSINQDNGLELQDTEPGLYDNYEKKETKKAIEDAIKSLHYDHRIVVVLRDMQGFSYEEISEIIDVPLGTVKSRIKRARENIKEYLIKTGNFFSQISSNEVKEG